MAVASQSSAMNLDAPREGGCLCGGVRYRVARLLCGVVNCFCGQCRRTSGHYVAATRARRADLTLQSDATLRWYRSSSFAQRGFCERCGSSLFWSDDNEDRISIMAGTLDSPTNLATEENIYVEDAGDYHSIPELK